MCHFDVICEFLRVQAQKMKFKSADNDDDR